MARDESDREDLLREATALVERIELERRASGNLVDQCIVAGFRRDGALSIFFGEDPVYQFNSNGQLRRAYSDGKLLKANHGRLATLERVRTEQEVQLVRHDLSQDEEAAFLRQMSQRIRDFSRSLDENEFDVVGQVPPDGNVLGRVREWLATHVELQIAEKPNV